MRLVVFGLVDVGDFLHLGQKSRPVWFGDAEALAAPRLQPVF